MDDFSKARDVLRGIEEVKNKEERRTQKRADWTDPEDRSHVLAEQRMQKRLDRIPDDRKCPRCGLIRLDSRSWVVGRQVVCRSCALVRVEEGYGEFVEGVIVSVVIDGEALSRTRRGIGVSLKTFAELCEWSRQYQYNLESGRVKTIKEDVADRILRAIESLRKRTEG